MLTYLTSINNSYKHNNNNNIFDKKLAKMQKKSFGPGDTGIITPGHNAWVVGNEPVVAVDFTGAKDFAKKGNSNSSNKSYQASYILLNA